MRNFINAVLKTQTFAGIFLITIFLIGITFQVTARYLKITATWVDEFVGYSFIWAVMMGSSIMVKEEKHFAFNSLQTIFGKKNKIYFEIVSNVFVLIFTIALFYYGCVATKSFWNNHWINIPVFTVGYVWLCMPIAGFTMSLYTIDNIIIKLNKLKNGGANL